jgi:hypothetical protein
MDVRLPDGTVIKNVPDGMSKADFTAKLKANGYDISKLDAPAPVAPAASEIPGQRIIPEWAQRNPMTYGVVSTARDVLGPTVQALGAAGGAIGGAAAATPTGPVGMAAGGVAGAGLGYGTATEGLEALDVALGFKKPRTGAAVVTEPLKNVVEGATYEAGGRVLGQGLNYIGGKIADLRQIPLQKAATIARNALGGDLPEVLNALRNAPPGTNAAQATANITNPTWQALIERRLTSDPKFVLNLKNMNEAEGVNALAQLAGGATATTARGTTEAAKNALNTVTGPLRESALARGNLGKTVAGYESQADQLARAAAGKVEDVRFLERAKGVAEAAAAKTPARAPNGERIGMPLAPSQYTYAGDLAKQAEDWSAQAASGSLDLGQGARFAQGAADAMRSVGIKPLEGAPLANKIGALADKPEFAGNDILEGAVKTVANDIAKWTDSGGILDLKALDAIRKNSVTAAIQQLRPGADATTQRNLAASVLSKIKPLIDDTIENVGGTGYKQYLADYAKGMQRISEKKLSGEALKLYKTNKDEFVRLVQGESPDAVEKILGPGSYDIAKEVSENTMNVLQNQAAKVIRDANIKTQVTGGQEALKELLMQNLSKFRLPSYITAVAATTNKALQILENKIGAKTLSTLTESFKTPGAAADLLETLPGAERNRVIKLLADPKNWAQKTAGGAVAGTANALAPDNQNSLRVEMNGMAPQYP